MDRLYLDIDWGSDVKIDDFIVWNVTIIIDPSTYSDVWGDMFLKNMSHHFSKNNGVKILSSLKDSGGVTLNGRQLYDDANTEIDRIEEEVQLKYQLPDDFMIG